MFFEHLQGRWLHHLPGQSIPTPDHSLREGFPNIQPEPPLAQLEAKHLSIYMKLLDFKSGSHFFFAPHRMAGCFSFTATPLPFFCVIDQLDSTQ